MSQINYDSELDKDSKVLGLQTDNFQSSPVFAEKIARKLPEVWDRVREGSNIDLSKMDSVKNSQKSPPSNIGFYTQINNPVDSFLGNFDERKGEGHTKNRSGFNLAPGFPDSDYYQLTRIDQPKKKKKPAHKKSLNSKNYYSMKKDGLGVKSTHSSIIKRNRKKNHTDAQMKKGSSVALSKSQNKFAYSESVKRRYKNKSTWKKGGYSRAKQRKRMHHKSRKKEGRKRRDTLGVQSLKGESRPGPKGYSKDFQAEKTNISSVKNMESSSKHSRQKAKARHKEVMARVFPTKDNSYLTSSELSEVFDPPLEANRRKGTSTKQSFEHFHKTPKNFSGAQAQTDYGSGKMDFFQAKLNEIQSKYISSESYKLK